MARPLSKDTHQLVNSMIMNSGLNQFQKRTLMRELKDNGKLPQQVGPTSSYIADPPPLPAFVRQPPPPIKYQPKRTKASIVKATDNYKEEQALFRGPGPDRDKARHKLAVRMEQKVSAKSITSHATFVKAPYIDTRPKFDNRFDEIMNEINERKQFLSDMRSMGQSKDIEPIIAAQISELMIELGKVHNADVKRVSEQKSEQEADQVDNK